MREKMEIMKIWSSRGVEKTKNENVKAWMYKIWDELIIWNKEKNRSERNWGKKQLP